MYIFFGLVIACLAAVGHGLPSNQIIGGNDAEIGGYPYMVSLRYKNNHFCGGSIISKRYILTAAHCLTQFVAPNVHVIENLTIHAGTNFLSKTGYAYNAEKVIIHPQFDLSFIYNDIGLIRLKTDIIYNKLVQPLTVAVTNSALAGDSCHLTGWGKLQFLGEVSDKLQKVDLNVFPQDQCEHSFSGILESHICAFSKYGQGACHGDSGSPLVASGVQIGIASFVRPCAVGYPDVYTRVASFKDWIVSHVLTE